MIKYPLAKQTITNEEIDVLIEWLKTYPRLTMGELTKEFERKWAEYIGTKYSVFVNSGSSANLLMIYALLMTGQLKKGDKVLVPAVGWGTTIAPLIQLGLEPIMVDVDPFTFGIDPIQVKIELEKSNSIGAILFVDVLGVPAEIVELRKLAKEYNVLLLEDSCAALGSKHNGKMIGSFGDISTFSFYFGHQLSTIEGGMINTNDKEIYEALVMARSHGWGKELSQETYDTLIRENHIDDFHKPFTFFIPGFNLRGTDLQAKIGLGQLEKAEWVANRRHENHMRYMDNLKNHCEFQSPNDYPPDRVSSISFGCLVKENSTRKEVVRKLVENGIETRLFSAGNLGLHPFWKEYNQEFSNFGVANLIHSNGFFLPNYPELTLDEVDYISEIVIEGVKHGN